MVSVHIIQQFVIFINNLKSLNKKIVFLFNSSTFIAHRIKCRNRNAALVFPTFQVNLLKAPCMPNTLVTHSA